MKRAVTLIALALSTPVTSPFAHGQVLEEVVVTAQKRDQNVQDVGIAITALSGDQLDALGLGNAQQVTALAPGVSTVQPNGEANYTVAIRGAANSDFNTNQEAPVAIYVDEVYISQASGTGFMLFDMERVEILRGPQGTLFGRNSTGGLIHFVTRKPTQESDAYAQLSFGEYDQVKFEGAAGGGISDMLAARVSVSTHHNDGYVHNRLNGEDINNANDYAGRAQLLFSPGDQFEFLFNGRYSLQQIRTGFFENVSSVIPQTLTPGVPNPDLGGYVDNDGDVFAGDYDRQGWNDLETYGFSGTATWDWAYFTLTSISDFSSVKRDYLEDSDASPVDYFNFYLTTDAEQITQELRLNGDAEGLKWVAGFYFLDLSVHDSNGAEARGFLANLDLNVLGPDGFVANGIPTPQGLDSPYATDTSSWSLFGQLEYDIAAQWTGILGFRWIEEEVDFTYQNNFVNFIPGTRLRNGNPNIVVQQGAIKDSRSDGIWSARVELDWRPGDDFLGYASWNRGTKGGGWNAPFFGASAFTKQVLSFRPEQLDAYELGFKSTLFGGRARINASGFYYDYQDYQAFTIVLLDTLLVNSDSESVGAELEIITSPMDGLDLMFGASYIDADVTLPGATRDVRPVQTPKWNLNGLIRYDWPMFLGNMAVQADFQYRSTHFFSVTNLPTSTQSGYALANASISYTTANERWTARFFVDNITNEQYLVQTFDLSGLIGDGGFGLTEQYFGRPRWIGGSIRYTF